MNSAFQITGDFLKQVTAIWVCSEIRHI